MQTSRMRAECVDKIEEELYSSVLYTLGVSTYISCCDTAEPQEVKSDVRSSTEYSLMKGDADGRESL